MSHLNFLGIHMHMQPIGGRVYQANTSDQSQVFHGNYHKGVLQPLGGGRIAALKRWSLAVVGMRFLNLINTPI